LQQIGHVVDVHRLGAVFIAGLVLGRAPEAVAVRDGRPHLLQDSGWEEFPLSLAR
jgi:hypothetical protein